MLLPHGFEGCRSRTLLSPLGAFLAFDGRRQYPSHPAIDARSIFSPAASANHLRRSKPLVVLATPKSLLTPRRCLATRRFTSGTFQKILPDTRDSQEKGTQRVLLCSGKIYYELAEKLGSS